MQGRLFAPSPPVNVTFRKNRFDNNDHEAGIYVRGGNQSVISGNEIVNNKYGLIFHEAEMNRVEKDIIKGNSGGVMCSAPANADLGGGPAGSSGGNVIAGNANIDLLFDSSVAGTVDAANNFRDHVPPNIDAAI